jgi:hypothetical protein
VADVDKDEVRKIAIEVFEEECENIGLYFGDPEHLEVTRANFVKLNTLTAEAVALANAMAVRVKAKEGALRRSVRDVLIGMGGNGLWAIVGLSAGALFQVVWKIWEANK